MLTFVAPEISPRSRIEQSCSVGRLDLYHVGSWKYLRWAWCELSSTMTYALRPTPNCLHGFAHGATTAWISLTDFTGITMQVHGSGYWVTHCPADTKSKSNKNACIFPLLHEFSRFKITSCDQQMPWKRLNTRTYPDNGSNSVNAYTWRSLFVELF